MCSSTFDQKITIENVPDIKDVNLLIDLLDGMGVKVDKVNSTTYNFTSDSIDINYTKLMIFLINLQKLEDQ